MPVRAAGGRVFLLDTRDAYFDDGMRPSGCSR